MTMFIQNQLHWIQPNEDKDQSRTSSEEPLMSRVGNLLNAKLNKMCNPYNDTERPNGFVDLFLFAILFNRQRLGELMWRHCQDKLGTALVACSILKAFANTAGCYLESELSTDLMNHARDYERKAIGVLTECYKKDKTKAHDILIKTLEKPFDTIRPLELANRYQLKEFMGHDCCQTKLNIIWRGKITGHMRWWKILLALFMPLFFIFWIKFTTNEPRPVCCKKHKKEQKNEPERSTKMSYKTQFYSVGIPCKNHHGIIRITDAIYYLYTAPFSVYTFNMVSYMIFMVYFSYFIIVDLNEATSFKEYIIWGWALTLLFEELRECFFFMVNKKPRCCGQSRVGDKIRSWLGSHWNKFDLLINIIFMTTIAMRFTLSGNDFQYVRFLYSVTVGLYSMRFLHIFLVTENIGPKLVMIRKMVADLTYFLGIFIVFFVSFCVMYQANMYPNSSPNTPFLWENFFYTPYWQIFGELFLDHFIPGHQSEDCDPIAKSADGRKRCPEANRLVIFIAAIYITLTHILLINLLIAIFSHTFASVQEKSGQIWKYYWYGIVLDYYNRTVLCPPLIILGQIYRLSRYVVALCGGFEYDSEFRLNDEEGSYSKHLLKFADTAAKRYLQQNNNAKT
ncbi:transient receptor potential cation channel subfamily M member-like 2 [Dreissena polymorpha]|uniref:transient receptor potential cation channel subfamily M member-like 2 n=1 Tax=Dreissena polymorpha TaxID=45954 RepID=UPI0022654294|nr:transient receptor potential cation channel subfamily M member-like 2 [Dreissena polymorpha]